MGLSNLPASTKLFCPLRRKWVVALPEEKVRQSLIQQMLKQEYPISSLASEVSLSKFPHLKERLDLPFRRADLIVFCKNLHPNYPFYPLLLLECKAEPLTEKVVRQVIGYNHFAKAFFIAIANQKGIYLGIPHPQKKDFYFEEGLPSYQNLLQKAKDL